MSLLVLVGPRQAVYGCRHAGHEALLTKAAGDGVGRGEGAVGACRSRATPPPNAHGMMKQHCGTASAMLSSDRVLADSHKEVFFQHEIFLKKKFLVADLIVACSDVFFTTIFAPKIFLLQ